MPKTFDIWPKGQNFTKSGHTDGGTPCNNNEIFRANFAVD